MTKVNTGGLRVHIALDKSGTRLLVFPVKHNVAGTYLKHLSGMLRLSISLVFSVVAEIGLISVCKIAL